MSRLLRVLTALFALVFAVDAFAAGYSCPTYKKYTSCASGYYMTKGGTYNGTPVAGNACTSCPSGYTCAGGTADKKINAVTCSAGQYINGTTCKTCEAGYRCNGQTTYTPNGGIQGRTACSGSTEYQNSTGQTSCKAVSTGYYKSSNTAQTQCPSGYRVGAGAANQNSCVGNFTKTGSQIAPTAVPTNCKAITASGSCTPGTCTYKKNYAGIITSNCTATNCTKPITGVSAKTGYRTNGTSCTACPSGYPNSADGNTGGVTACYSNNKSRPWSGNQTACSKPSNAYSVTCNSCSGSACTYVAYSNSAGNGDGTIKSGCSSNSAACQQTVKSVTCNANYRVNGTSCTACPSGYPNSAANNSGGITACYSNNKSRAWTGGQTACGKPSNCASVTCNSCSGSACTYVAYSNSAGTGDGTIKSGCSSNSANCQQSVKSVTANAGYYANGTACTICPAGKYCTGGTAAAANCAAGTFRSTTGGTAASSCSACTGATYSGVGATGCTNCPSGYTANTASNKTAASQCQISVAGGKYVATANSATLTTCDAGYACPGGNVNYGSTGARNKCTGVTYSGAGASACTTCPNSATGYYIAGDIHTTINSCYKNVPWTGSHGNGTRNCYYTSGTGTSAVYSSSCDAYKASKCAAAYYYVSGADCTSVGTGYWSAADSITRTQCPTNYQVGAAASAQSGCKTNCAAGTRVATANAACSAITSGNVYMLAHSVNYGATSAAATACPTGYSISGTTAADHDAKNDCKISCGAGTRVASADAVCTTPSGNWYVGAHTVAAGSTSSVNSCLANYTISGTAAADHDAASDCRISCGAGTRIVSANATSCTTPSGNWYVGAHSVPQGSTSSVNSCLANYSISGTAATNHDAASDCRISCSGGTYIAAANNTSCSNVGAGYWAAASTVSQGSAGARNQCASGLTTIGYGAGADEAGDCGRILNVGTDKVYLRSTKKTTPSLNIKIGDQTYYGNMSTATKGKLRVKNGTTTYSVHDDSK